MKIYTEHDYKKKTLLLRSFDLIPSICINLYPNYKFESIRFSWLGFTIGVYFEIK